MSVPTGEGAVQRELLARLQEAGRQAQAGQHAAAESLYRELLAAEPAFHPGWHAAALLAFQTGRSRETLERLERAVALAPEVALYQRNLGEMRRRLGDLTGAIDAGKRACKLAPDDVDACYNLGLALADAGRYAEAVERYRQALRQNPRHHLSWNNLGSALERMEDGRAAEEAYARAVAIEPGNAEAWNNLGAIRLEQGMLDDACDCFGASIKAQPYFVDAHYNLSSLHTYTPADPYLHYLEQLFGQRHLLPPDRRVRYLFVLGKALDDVGESERAFAAWEEGNRLVRSGIEFDELREDERAECITRTFTRQFMSSRSGWLGATGGPVPLFIVGMPRSGTTLVEQILCSHHLVHGGGELPELANILGERAKGDDFFDLATRISEEQMREIGEDYLARLARLAPGARYVTDKMPANFFFLGIIRLALPEARIIHILRDPMDSCFSAYTRLFTKTMEFSCDLGTLGRYYNRYRQLMQHWSALLPADTLFDLTYEELVADSEARVHELLDFVGLPWDDACLRFHENRRPIKTASIVQVHRPINAESIGRWRRYAPQLVPLLSIVRRWRQMTPDDEKLLDQAGSPLAEDAATAYNRRRAGELHVTGIGHYQSGRFNEAISCLDRAIDLEAENGVIHNSRGFVLQDLGRLEEALAAFERAVELAPEMAMARLNLAMIQLKLGDWESGWENYEARWTGSAEATAGVLQTPSYPLPQWTGSQQSEGRSLLVVTEQGFGDVFWFSRLFEQLLTRFDRVAFVCSIPTLRLMEWSFGDRMALFSVMPADVSDWDYYCPLLSLARALALRPDNVPANLPCLHLPQPAIRRWRERLNKVSQGSLRVGIAWAGRSTHQYDARRTLRFEQILPLLDERRVCWVNLQKWSPEQGAPRPPEGVCWIDWTPELADFADTAGLLSSLDLVISVDSAMVHLAGALALPVWMLDRFDNEWRWGHGSEVSPWYPEMRIFRQRRFGEWQPVVERVRKALADLAKEGGYPAAVGSALCGEKRATAADGDGAASLLSPPDAPRPPAAALEQAARLHAAGRGEESGQLLEYVLQAEPDNPHALHLSGLIAYDRGDGQAALELMGRAVAAAPRFAHLRTNFGEMLRQQGRLEEAIAEAVKAVELAPGMAMAHSNLGIALFDDGQLDRAVTCHRQAIELEPKMVQSLNNLASIEHQRGNLKGAIDGYRRVLEVAPDYVETLSNLGAVLLEAQRVDEAAGYLERALLLLPDYPVALCNLGLVRLQQQRYADARSLLERTLALRRDYPEALAGLSALRHLEEGGATI